MQKEYFERFSRITSRWRVLGLNSVLRGFKQSMRTRLKVGLKNTSSERLFIESASRSVLSLQKMVKDLQLGFKSMGGGVQSIETSPFIRQSSDSDVKGEWIYSPGDLVDAQRSASFEDSESLPPVIVFIHGGAFMLCSPITHRAITTRLAVETGYPLFAIDYPLAPEHPFPAALDVCAALCAKFRKRKFVIVGDSAGGNLTIASSILLNRRTFSPPQCIVALSPWLDLNCSRDSYKRNSRKDPFIPSDVGHIVAGMYINQDKREGHDFLQDPLVSPMYLSDDEISALPPLLCHVGESEVLLDDTLDFVRRFKRKGSARAVVFEDMPHDFHLFAPFLKESSVAIKDIAEFIRKHC